MCLRIALHSKLDRIDQMLRDKDIKATDAFRDLEKHSRTVLEGLEDLKQDSKRSQILFGQVGQWAASIPAHAEFAKQVLGWSLHMGDANERLGYEIEAIESTLEKMRTYTTEKNAMIKYLLESIKDVRCLHDRLRAKPATRSTETQTDLPEPLTNVSVTRNKQFSILLSLLDYRKFL